MLTEFRKLVPTVWDAAVVAALKKMAMFTLIMPRFDRSPEGAEMRANRKRWNAVLFLKI